MGAAYNHETAEPLPGAAAHDRDCGYRVKRLGDLRPPENDKGGDLWRRWGGFITNDAAVMIRVLAEILWLVLRYRVRVVCLGELVYNGWLVFPLRYLFRRTVIFYTHGEEISQEDGGFLSTKRGVFLEGHANRIISVSLFCKKLDSCVVISYQA